MTTTTEDDRFLRQVGVTMEDRVPIPMVSGERYAELVNRNDELVTRLREAEGAKEQLAQSHDKLQESREFWRILAYAFAATTAFFFLSALITISLRWLR